MTRRCLRKLNVGTVLLFGYVRTNLEIPSTIVPYGPMVLSFGRGGCSPLCFVVVHVLVRHHTGSSSCSFRRRAFSYVVVLFVSLTGLCTIDSRLTGGTRCLGERSCRGCWKRNGHFPFSVPFAHWSSPQLER